MNPSDKDYPSATGPSTTSQPKKEQPSTTTMETSELESSVPSWDELMKVNQRQHERFLKRRLAMERARLSEAPTATGSTQDTPCPAPAAPAPAPAPAKAPQRAAQKTYALPPMPIFTDIQAPEKPEPLLPVGKDDDGSFEEVDSPEDDDYEHVAVPAKEAFEHVEATAILDEDYETVDGCEGWKDCGGEYDTIPEEYHACRAEGETPAEKKPEDEKSSEADHSLRRIRGMKRRRQTTPPSEKNSTGEKTSEG